MVKNTKKLVKTTTKKTKKTPKKIVKTTEVIFDEVKKSGKKGKKTVRKPKAKTFTEAEVQVKIDEINQAADAKVAEVEKAALIKEQELTNKINAMIQKAAEDKQHEKELADLNFAEYRKLMLDVANLDTQKEEALNEIKPRIQRKIQDYIVCVENQTEKLKQLISFMTENWNDEMRKLHAILIEELKAQMEAEKAKEDEEETEEDENDEEEVDEETEEVDETEEENDEDVEVEEDVEVTETTTEEISEEEAQEEVEDEIPADEMAEFEQEGNGEEADDSIDKAIDEIE